MIKFSFISSTITISDSGVDDLRILSSPIIGISRNAVAYRYSSFQVSNNIGHCWSLSSHIDTPLSKLATILVIAGLFRQCSIPYDLHYQANKIGLSYKEPGDIFADSQDGGRGLFNYGVICEDKAKRRNSRAKAKIFEENCYLLPYAVSSKEDTAYQRQLITRIRVSSIPDSAYHSSPIRRIHQLVVSQRSAVDVIDGNWCMTRSSTKELLTPFENPERHIEEEVTKIMAKKMEQYMSKTRREYRSGVARPKIDANAQLELKGQFLKELRDNTFSDSKHEDANEHIEKVLEIVDLFHIPNITQDQVMLHAFPVSLTGAASRWLRNEPAGSITTWEVLKKKFLNKFGPPARTAKKMEEINNFQQEPDEIILFYNGLDVPTRQILDSRGSISIKIAADAKVVIQEMAEYSQKWHNGISSKSRSTKTSDGLAAIQAQLNSLGREI
ncbi:retrovirus-related pol polyprotein from transposon TNT 1-94 [Tanacetum coccineum]